MALMNQMACAVKYYVSICTIDEEESLGHDGWINRWVHQENDTAKKRYQ